MDNNDFQNLLDTYWAKSPDTNGVAETISEHTECVLKEADLLVQLGYISDDLSNLLHYACEKHDYGKVNEHMQTRLHNKASTLILIQRYSIIFYQRYLSTTTISVIRKILFPFYMLFYTIMITIMIIHPLPIYYRIRIN